MKARVANRGRFPMTAAQTGDTLRALRGTGGRRWRARRRCGRPLSSFPPAASGQRPAPHTQPANRIEGQPLADSQAASQLGVIYLRVSEFVWGHVHSAQFRLGLFLLVENLTRARSQRIQPDFLFFLFFKNIWSKLNLSKTHHNSRNALRLLYNSCVTRWLAAQVAVRHTVTAIRRLKSSVPIFQFSNVDFFINFSMLIFYVIRKIKK
jgi:hypothetical protein